MKRILLFAFSLAGFFTTTFAQMKDSIYKKQWAEIDSLITEKRLPKSALQHVNALYAKAKAENQKDEAIKALLYRLSLEQKVTETDINKQIATVEKEISDAADEAEASVLLVTLANKYQEYFDNNSYRLSGRSATVNFRKDDVTSWSADDFNKTITALYTEALKPASVLQQQTPASFNALIIKGNTENLRPTLYDLLAHKALDYFKNDNGYFTKPIFAFEITDPAALGHADEFIRHQFSSQDSSSNLLQSILLFQQLMQFHQQDADPSAFIDINLERIDWVNENTMIVEPETLYKHALEDITKSFPGNSVAAQAWYLLAEIDAENAKTYTPFGDSTHRYDYVKAKQQIEEILLKHPVKSEGNSNMQRLLAEITKKDLKTQVENVNVPGQPFRMYVEYRNIQLMHVRIITASEISKLQGLNKYDQGYWKAVTQLHYFKTFTQQVPDTKDFQQHSTEIKIDALEPGSYALLASSSADFNDSTDKLSIQAFDVSSISFINNGPDYWVLNRETGQPLKSVKVKFEFFKWDYNERKNVVSNSGNISVDANGYFSMKDLAKGKEGNYSLTFYAGKDSLKTTPNGYYAGGTNGEQEINTETVAYEKQQARFYLFTDRSIYRPGQTVFFKAIAVTKDKETGKPKKPGITHKINFILRNANGESVDTVAAELNSYGSLSATFKLPTNVLTGNFTIIVENYNGISNFNVEEYKRPKFYVEFDTLKTTYRLGDRIKITGYAKAYAGNNIDGADVKFHVLRRTRFIYPWIFWRTQMPAASSQPIINGEIMTDADGKFEISFIAKPDASVDKATDPVFDFDIDATITDINGETRDGSTLVSIGYKSLKLNLSVPSAAEIKSFDSVKVSTQNLSGAKVAAKVNLNVYPLKMPAKVYRSRYWQRPDQFVMDKADYEKLFPYDEYENESDYHEWQKGESVFSDSLNTADAAFIKINGSSLKQGWYAVQATTKDKDGNEVKDEQYVQLYDEQSTSLPSMQTEWSIPVKDVGQPGEKAKLLLGTNEKDVFVIQQLKKNANDDAGSTYNYLKLSNQKKAIDVDITEESRKGLGLYYAFVKRNRVYTNGMNISVPFLDKNLDIIYNSFRNKTEPGSKEQWTVEVKGDKGEKIAAELLTTMYDASLDQFKPHSWNIPDLWSISFTRNMFMADDNFTVSNSEENYIAENVGNYEKFNDELAVKWEDFFWNLKTDRLMGGRLMGMVSANQNKMLATSALEQQTSKIEIIKLTAPKIVKDEEVQGYMSMAITSTSALKQSKNLSFQPRTNFNETAFFIPNLYADTAGNYTFSFTIPEALTEWKWMSFAHTKDLKFGYKEDKIITQKTLMVQPNLPRFVREGDQMEFSAKVSNLADIVLTGNVSLQLFDATTNDAIDGAFQSVFPDQYFTVEPGRSNDVKFPVSIPFGFNKPVTIKIIARAGNYADGEENTLPVLTNRMLVTESLPLYVRGEGTKQFKFEKLLNNTSATLSNESIIVEYTPNPIWFAIQALPYVAEAKNDCAEQVFNRFYANALASYLVKQHPRIKEVFDRWKTDTAALKSNLDENPELKQLLLEETPWVVDATNETRQMKNVALLFDVMKMSDAMESSLQQLKQMQLPDGSFPWFKGGYSDRYITQNILTGIGRLKMLKAFPAEQSAQINEFVLKALDYSDNEIIREYNLILKSKVDKNKNNLTSSGIQYLFMRSYFKDVPLKDKNAHSFYFFQAMKYWNTQSVYMQGMIAATLFRNYFRTYTYKNIIPSILENAVEDEAKGMYFKNSPWGYYWYQNPVEQQSLLIELLNEMQPFFKDEQMKSAVNEMRTWLLLNKQTNNWKTTKATADACYALLLNGNSELSANRRVQIRLGDQIIQQNSATEGTGYIKTRIDGDEVNNALGNIQVTVQSQGNSENMKAPSWGSVYWQYFEDLDKITQAATPLSLDKKLFLEKNTTSGKVLVPVNDNDELKVGDKLIIRMELRSDRDMEYLHLKDMRAAAMEPLNVLSEYKWQDGLGYYEATKDASSDFFFSYLPKGTYVFEYPCYVTQSGNFAVGIATIQCMYSPDFSSHSEGIRINVEKK